MKALALVTVILLVSAVTIAHTVTRVRGFGMMDENETAASQDNSQAATFTQNQLNCLNLDDGWWSPIAGPVVVRACGPPTKTEESSNLQGLSKQTETSATSAVESIKEAVGTPEVAQQLASTSLPPTDVTETNDNEGNTVLSSTSQNLTITAVTAIKGAVGTPEVVQQVARQDPNESKIDYNWGLLDGIHGAFHIGERLDLYKDMKPKEINELIAHQTQGQSDAYRLGFSRGMSLGANFVTITGISGLPYKERR